jgi:hypothetical protein
VLWPASEERPSFPRALVDFVRSQTLPFVCAPGHSALDSVCRVDLVRAQHLQRPIACFVLSALSLFKSFDFYVDFCVNRCSKKSV